MPRAAFFAVSALALIVDLGSSFCRVTIESFSPCQTARGQRWRAGGHRPYSSVVADAPAVVEAMESVAVAEVSVAEAAPRKKPVRASSKAPKLVITGDTIEEEPHMVVTVVATFALATFVLLRAAVEASTPLMGFESVAAAIGGLLFADFFTGIFHFLVDNYGNGSTPVFGSVIEAFQGHHDSPWTITSRGFANNVHKICYGVLPLLALVALVGPGPVTSSSAVAFLVASVMSQELHKFSHMISPPAPVRALQDAGVILSRRAHGQHHSSPFQDHYCIVTGHCNEFMDKSGIFRLLENIIYKATGVESNTWKLDHNIKNQALRMM